MCLGIPMQVMELLSPSQARCADRGQMQVIDIALVAPVQPGDWLMTFLGSAREKMDEISAGNSLGALEALRAIMSGEEADIAAAFPDLVGREPQLPEHLRRPVDAEAQGADK